MVLGYAQESQRALLSKAIAARKSQLAEKAAEPTRNILPYDTGAKKPAPAAPSPERTYDMKSLSGAASAFTAPIASAFGKVASAFTPKPVPAKPDVKAPVVVAPAPVKTAPPKPVAAPVHSPMKAPVIDNKVVTPTSVFAAAAKPVTPPAFTKKTWMNGTQTDANALLEDAKANMSVEDLRAFTSKFQAAKTKGERDMLMNGLKDSVNAKLSSKVSSAAPATRQVGAFENMANLTDAEKVAQARQATYGQKNVEYENKQKAAYDALAGLNDQYKAAVLRSLGIKADGTPDLSNAEGQYAKSKKLYDDLVANNAEAFKTIRTQVEADLGGAGRQLIIQAGLSGADMDPAALGLKMGATGQKALGLVNDAKQAMLKQEGTILQQKNTELAKLVSDGLLSAEGYDKATAAAKAQYDSNVYDNSLKLLEAAFGQQEVANAYDETNRKERVNTISAALTNLGLTPQQSAELLSTFNFRRDANGNLETPERALLRLSEWTKSDANSINPQFLPTTPEEIASWKNFQKYMTDAAARTKAKAEFDAQIELLKAQKSGSSGSGLKLPASQAILLRAALASGGANVSDTDAQFSGGDILSALTTANANPGSPATFTIGDTQYTIPAKNVVPVLETYKKSLGTGTQG
jgi:hypothetical protein